MIVERLVFSLKFGKAKDAKALMKESKNVMPPEMHKNMRVLFDLVGPSYTMVMESTYESLTAMEAMYSKEMPNAKEMEAWYQKFIPLVEKSYKEMWTVYE
jgi:hypothetical protein